MMAGRNVGDPQQILEDRSQRSWLADNYLNWDSNYNTGMRRWLNRMFGASAGGADSTFAAGLDPSSGVGAAALAARRARAADSAAGAAWQQYQGGQQLGVQAQIAWDQDTVKLQDMASQRQMFNDQRRDQALGDVLGGVASLGLTALTGGFGNLFGGGGGDSFMGNEMDAAVEGTVGGYVDQGGNLTASLAKPNYLPEDPYAAQRKYNGWTNPVAMNDPGVASPKRVTWGNALDFSGVRSGARTSASGNPTSSGAGMSLPGFYTAPQSSTYVASASRMPGSENAQKNNPWRFTFSRPSYGTPGGWRLY